LDGPVGFECGRRFAAAGALVVFMTANHAALPRDLGGAYGVIAKPFTDTGLLKALTYLRQVATGEPCMGSIPEGLEVAVGKRSFAAPQISPLEPHIQSFMKGN